MNTDIDRSTEQPTSVLGKSWVFIGGWASRDGLYFDDRDRTRPWLLRTLYVISVLVVPTCLIGSVAAAFNFGSFQLNGSTMTGHEFVRRGGLAWLLAIGLGGGSLARALRSPSPFVRQTLLSIFVGLFVIAIVAGARPDAGQAFVAVLEIGLAAWYLYLKPSSKEYFSDGSASSSSSS